MKTRILHLFHMFILSLLLLTPCSADPPFFLHLPWTEVSDTALPPVGLFFPASGNELPETVTAGADLNAQPPIQDLLLSSNIPGVVREGDIFSAEVLVSNASGSAANVEISGVMHGLDDMQFESVPIELPPGETKGALWKVAVPSGITELRYDFTAREKERPGEFRISVSQVVTEAYPVRVVNSVVTQVETFLDMDVEKPIDAAPDKGGIAVSISPDLTQGLGSIIRFMESCACDTMEQKISRAVALRDSDLWKSAVTELSAHIDPDGLVKQFPAMQRGSDILTAYIVSIAHEAGMELPKSVLARLEDGLLGFAGGRLVLQALPVRDDLVVRKLAALEALSRVGKARADLVGTLKIVAASLPDFAVLDWITLLSRIRDIPDRELKLKEAERVLRSRMTVQGSAVIFSAAGNEDNPWVMASADTSAVRAILAFLDSPAWAHDMPGMLQGALMRQRMGHWQPASANAWGVLAMEKYAGRSGPMTLTGATTASLDGISRNVDWTASADGLALKFSWPRRKELLSIHHMGRGRPWISVQSLAALQLKGPLFRGYSIRKTVTPVQQKLPNTWSGGDMLKVRLEIEARADMPWVSVKDPAPAGAVIIAETPGRGLLLKKADGQEMETLSPVFEDRGRAEYRSYYERMPRGTWVGEYTLRLNSSGSFNVPLTRVEALYSQEVFGEIPNRPVEIVR